MRNQVYNLGDDIPEANLRDLMEFSDWPEDQQRLAHRVINNFNGDDRRSLPTQRYLPDATPTRSDRSNPPRT